MKFNTKHWYYNLFVGLLLITISFYFLINPLMDIYFAKISFSFFFIINGLFQFFIGLLELKKTIRRGWDLISGILSVGLGIYLMMNLSMTLEILNIVISIYCIYKGIEQMSASLYLQAEKLGWTFSSGLLSILIGITLLFFPHLSPYIIYVLISIMIMNLGWMELIVASIFFKKVKLQSTLGKI